MKNYQYFIFFIRVETSCISLEYSIKALGSLKGFNPMLSLFLIKNWYLSSYGSLAYKYILSISGWLFIKLSNAFVFPDPEPPIFYMDDQVHKAN